MHRRLVPRFALAAALLVAPLVASGCASVSFERDTPDSGRFTSSAVAFTFLSYDLPSPALSIARSNAADSRLAELVVEEEIVFPYLWRLDWLLDILSIRYARVSGTWGIPLETPPGSRVKAGNGAGNEGDAARAAASR